MASTRDIVLWQRWKYVALGLVAICAVVMVIFAVGTPASRYVNTEPGAWPVIQPDDARPVAVFIGGSVAVGEGASDPAHRWTSLLSEARAWEEVNLAADGAGYLAAAKAGACAEESCNFRAAAAAAVSESPTIVVVSGGEGDQGKDVDAVGEAVAATFRGLRTGAPDAILVAVGPASTRLEPGRDLVAIDAAVQEAASSVGAVYVSLLDPNVLSPDMLADDGTTINALGHGAIAARIAAAL